MRRIIKSNEIIVEQGAYIIGTHDETSPSVNRKMKGEKR